MILRRVIIHVREQNWTAVAIDFMIVVTGVFLGIQLGNWNAARIDQQREGAFLAGLARDVGSDVAEIDAILHVATVRMSALAWLIETATGELLPAGFESARGRIEIEPVPPYVEGDPRPVGISAAKTYWLFTNRHLKLMGDLRREADALLVRLEAGQS